ncbi:hypothetical protein OG785_45175 [Streptomyces sp. NBC_00006]|uniref:hypothetical protein n=1 Tax=Streptomyces sp. NBC_00006 TaxID=2975619 RepID=UPI00225A4097|nr:hypothetical protein [Streptomyces sp. NBC_00006]MCX5529016.1 hypothetical protein [Streptomyces sp. NBC_00006]MCX5537752.1 hypothetical protein [Streptomyces sp. NBC_00006]
MTDRLTPQSETETPAELREALIGFCLVALPNEPGFEKAERLADRLEAAVRAESAAELAAVRAERDELAKRAIRAIHALKSPTPEGSAHYQSGWDTGLEAAMDAVRGAAEGASS